MRPAIVIGLAAIGIAVVAPLASAQSGVTERVSDLVQVGKVQMQFSIG